MKIVKFLKSWRVYSKGEVAGFDEDVAKKLIENKVAEEYKATKGKETEPAK